MLSQWREAGRVPPTSTVEDQSRTGSLEGRSSIFSRSPWTDAGRPAHACPTRVTCRWRKRSGNSRVRMRRLSLNLRQRLMRFVWRCSGRNARSGGDASAPPRKRTDPAETKDRPRGYPSPGAVDLSRPYRFTANAGKGHPAPRVFEERLSQRHFTMMPQVNAVLSGRQRTGSGKCRFVWLALQAEALVASWRPCPGPPHFPRPGLCFLPQGGW